MWLLILVGLTASLGVDLWWPRLGWVEWFFSASSHDFYPPTASPRRDPMVIAELQGSEWKHRRFLRCRLRTGTWSLPSHFVGQSKSQSQLRIKGWKIHLISLVREIWKSPGRRHGDREGWRIVAVAGISTNKSVIKPVECVTKETDMVLWQGWWAVWRLRRPLPGGDR